MAKQVRKLELHLSDDEESVELVAAPTGTKTILATPPRPVRAPVSTKRRRDDSDESSEDATDRVSKRVRRSLDPELALVPGASREVVDLTHEPATSEPLAAAPNPCWGCAHGRPSQLEHSCLSHYHVAETATAAPAPSPPPSPKLEHELVSRVVRQSHCWGCVNDRPGQREHACLGYGGAQEPFEDMSSSAGGSQDVLSQAS
jgi:hypothetical protein